jgi:uncharacterized membrane protein YraQ (UPF0718 family)
MNDFLYHIWNISRELAPWLLLGLAVAGLLHVLLPTGFISRHLGHGRFASVFKASLFGVPLPLCSCGVIPAALGLRKDGASKGASVSFLISTPQTGVDSVAVTASLLGLPFALFKVFSAFVMGIAGGMLVNAADPDSDQPPSHSKTASKQHFPHPISEAFRFSYFRLFHEIWLWLLIGIGISALITTLLPEGSLSNFAWASGISGMLIMLVIGLPLYVCATGSVPIAASLVAAGMPTGAALVFLMAGPATNVATVGAVIKTFGKKITGIYLAVIIAGSIGLGMLFNSLFAPIGGGHIHDHYHFLPEWVHTTAVVMMFLGMAHFAVLAIAKKMKPKATQPSLPSTPTVMVPLQDLKRGPSPLSKPSCCTESGSSATK